MKKVISLLKLNADKINRDYLKLFVVCIFYLVLRLITFQLTGK